MNAKKLLKAYGLWLGGVLSAALAAWLLYRSRAITYDAEGEWYGEQNLEPDYGGDVLPQPVVDLIDEYTPGG